MPARDAPHAMSEGADRTPTDPPLARARAAYDEAAGLLWMARAGARASRDVAGNGGVLWRDALRTVLALAAVLVVGYPFFPRRPPPPPVLVPPFGGYVATCCARPLDPADYQEPPR